MKKVENSEESKPTLEKETVTLDRIEAPLIQAQPIITRMDA